jgi:hypothetical protein
MAKLVIFKKIITSHLLGKMGTIVGVRKKFVYVQKSQLTLIIFVGVKIDDFLRPQAVWKVAVFEFRVMENSYATYIIIE